MQIERVVINASPLITLFRAGLHPLLQQLFSELYVAEAVWDEVIHGGHDDPARHGLAEAEWVEKITTTVAQEVLTWSLVRFEAEGAVYPVVDALLCEFEKSKVKVKGMLC